MKTKLTFLSLAVVALLGVGMLMAFKQEDKHKQYMTMTLIGNAFNKAKYVIAYDENNQKIEPEGLDVKLTTNQALNKLINDYASKGYKLHTVNTYLLKPDEIGSVEFQYTIVFEKE